MFDLVTIRGVGSFGVVQFITAFLVVTMVYSWRVCPADGRCACDARLVSLHLEVDPHFAGAEEMVKRICTVRHAEISFEPHNLLAKTYSECDLAFHMMQLPSSAFAVSSKFDARDSVHPKM